jgi:ribonuclease HI
MLYAYVTADADGPHGPLSVVFVDARGRAHEHVSLAPSRADTGCERAFRGIVYALWNARKLGYRRVVVHSDEPSAVAQLNGERRVDPSLIGPYLEARALMRAYRSARIETGELRWQSAPDPGSPARVTFGPTEQLSILPHAREPLLPALAGSGIR